jgi:pimeloyl-ACP methyl ester carboxylesterase
VSHGDGEPVVLIHGNGTWVEDFNSSNLIELASKNYRVIAFDRPGFGYSSRPRGSVWTPSAQADLLHKALDQLGVERFILLGHSFGATVAMAMALRRPAPIRKLVLLSGYYYPTDRLDSILFFPVSLPIIGDLLRYTINPLLGRLLWPALAKNLFSPASMPEPFRATNKEMALRPSQLRSTAADSALLIPGAIEMSKHYQALSTPVHIIVGGSDQVINATTQSLRLHREIAGSALDEVPGLGHMIHYGAPSQIMAAVSSPATEQGRAGRAERQAQG